MTTARKIAIEGFEGPLAEFSALRDEIQELVKAQHHILSLQLTLAAAVFGFAISRPGMTALLLIIPFSSYLLCGRLVAHHFGTRQVATYIKDELSDRVPGGLHWERWLELQRPRHPHFLGSTMPLLLSFVGTGVLALIWTIGYVFVRDDITAILRVGLASLWVLGLTTTVISTVLILQKSGRLRVHSRNPPGR